MSGGWRAYQVRRPGPVRRPIAADPDQPGRRAQARLRDHDRCHRLQRDADGTGHPVRGPGPAGTQRLGHAAGQRGAPSPLPDHRRRPGGAGRAAQDHAEDHARRPQAHRPARVLDNPVMAAALAARLSRVLVGCHPRRWRQRYADEMLDVLEQHRAGARTVLDLAFSTLDTHLDREWRDWSWMRRGARAALPYALVMTGLAVIAGCMAVSVWRDDHWHPDRASGVNALVFAPGRPI